MTVAKRRLTSSRLLIWIVLSGTLVPCAAVLYGILDDRASAGVGLPKYCIYSDDRDGLAQAGALLRNLGFTPVALTRPVQQSHLQGLLIVVDPGPAISLLGSAPMLSDTDLDGLLAWVQKGNTLLYCSPKNSKLHTKLGIAVDEAAATEFDYSATPGAVGDYTAGVGRIGLESPATVSGRRAVPLWFENKPAAVAVLYGKGRVLVLPDPSILTHRGLLREDNAVFLYDLAAREAEDGKVYFDEYHHGFRSGGGFWSYLRYHDQQGIAWQLLLAAAVAAWSTGRRLGPAVPLPKGKQADGVAYASSVARILENADVRPVIAGVYARNFLDAVTKRLGLRRGAALSEILAAWRERQGAANAAELEALLSLADEFGAGKVPKTDGLLTVAQKFDDFLNRNFRRSK
jgi:hypothetical protein